MFPRLTLAGLLFGAAAILADDGRVVMLGVAGIVGLTAGYIAAAADDRHRDDPLARMRAERADHDAGIRDY